jgi:hypothetical protein
MKTRERVKTYGERERRKSGQLFGFSKLLSRAYKVRYCFAVRAYRHGLFRLSRRLCKSAYWAEYAAELGAQYWAGERLPNEQGAGV